MPQVEGQRPANPSGLKYLIRQLIDQRRSSVDLQKLSSVLPTNLGASNFIYRG